MNLRAAVIRDGGLSTAMSGLCVWKESWFRGAPYGGLGGFANGNVIKWFGEVAYGTDACVPMGNGVKGSSSGSLSITNMFY